MQAFEKLGAFYLGRPYDLATKRRGEGWLLYDSRDLVTHAVCVGMTGSGKTGLCICLLEEAAIDGVPAIVIDPKGDLSNLLLTFPQLRPDDFRPWVNPDDARRKGVDVDTFAAQQAALWRDGLAEWGQDGERIARLRAAADFDIYTPGSEAGIPVSILRSLEAPPGGPDADSELARERIATTVTSLLGLLGLDADPIRSREHILLSTLLSRAWSSGAGSGRWCARWMPRAGWPISSRSARPSSPPERSTRTSPPGFTTTFSRRSVLKAASSASDIRTRCLSSG